MRIPESHIDIIKEKTNAVLSTINKSEVYSAFCFIHEENEEVLLDSLEEEQINHIRENEKVAIMTIDSSNVDRWFCIQGKIKPKEDDVRFQVNIQRIIKFPK